MTIALIAGATGLVGEYCLQSLLKSTSYDKVIAITRTPLADDLCARHQDKLENIIVDFDALSSALDGIKVDDVFCCLGTTIKQAGSVAAFRKVDYDYCYLLAKTTKTRGAQHFLIVTAINANANSLAYYSKIKGQLEMALKGLHFERLSIFQPSFLLGVRKDSRLLETAVGAATQSLSKLLIGKLSSFKAVEGEFVAKAMVAKATLASDEKRGTHFLRYSSMHALADRLI